MDILKFNLNTNGNNNCRSPYGCSLGYFGCAMLRMTEMPVLGKMSIK